MGKLNEQIEGKASSLYRLILKDGLLDSFLALYDECKRKANLTKKKHQDISLVFFIEINLKPHLICNGTHFKFLDILVDFEYTYALIQL